MPIVLLANVCIINISRTQTASCYRCHQHPPSCGGPSITSGTPSGRICWASSGPQGAAHT